MILDSLRFFAAQFRYPESRKLGLLNSSLMIADRRKKLAAHWQFHLERTKEEQETWAGQIQTPGADSLLILGAGRLFDVNLKALSAVFDRITFIDADPLSVPTWRKAEEKYSDTKLDWEVKELSGAITSLRAAINKMHAQATWSEVIERIDKLPVEIKPIDTICALNPQPDAILSLNLLSQIPVLWQDILLKELQRRFPVVQVHEGEAEWLNAFKNSAKALVEQHLRALANSGAQNLLLITDVEYSHYRVDHTFESSRHEEPPIVFDSAGWRASEKFSKDGSLDVESYRALYGVDLEEDGVLGTYFPQYRQSEYRTWLWHIRPKIVSGGVGTIHRVAAFHLVKEVAHD